VLAAGGAQNIHLWDVTTGEKIGTWRGHQSQIYGLAWSAAHGMLASASGDGTVRIWDTRQGTTVKILGGSNTDEVYSLAWSPDGSKVVAGSRAGTVVLWDAATGKRLAAWTGPAMQGAVGPNPYAVWGVAWSPDGKRIVSNRYDKKVLVWDTASGKNLALLTPDSQPNGVTWAPDGARFATSGDDGSVQFWDGMSYKNTAVLSGGVSDGDGWAYGVTWTPDGGVLAVSRAVGSVQLWDTSAGSRLATFTAHEAATWTAAWSPDGLRLATGSDDTTVAVWGVR
jgi:WD40 repeat protein